MTARAEIRNTEIHETLVKARQIMVEQGLTKGKLWDRKSGAVCMRGAIVAAAWGSPIATRRWSYPEYPEYRFLTDCEAALGFYDITEVPIWNNYPHTTLEMVLKRFDRAIAATAPIATATPTTLTPELTLPEPQRDSGDMESPLDGTQEETRVLVGV